tara:strand:+ start:3890 stop:5047 length:1158 start_codon:yes stop_codon:yes gene_type:complete
MFDLTDADLNGEDKIDAVPEGEEGQAIDATIENGNENNADDDGDEGDVVNSDEDGEEGDGDSVDDPEEGDEGDNEEGNEEEGDESDESKSYQNLIEELSDNNILSLDEEKEYEASSEGLQSLIKENLEKAKSSAFDEYINSLDGDTKLVVDALQAGATLEDIKNGEFAPQEVDFSKVALYDEVGSPKETNMVHLIEDQAMKAMKYSLEEAQERALEIKDAGLLEKEAQRAKKWLVSNQESTIVSRDEKLAQMKQEKIDREREEVEGFKREVLETKDINGFKVSASDSEKLYDYMTDPVGPKGETQYEIDGPNRLLAPYLAMKKYNVESLSKSVKTKQAIKFRKKLANSQDHNTKAKGTSMNGSSRGQTKDRENLDLSIFDKILHS